MAAKSKHEIGSKPQRPSPDIGLRNYLKSDEHYADTVNASLFDGEQVVEAKDLFPADTDASGIAETPRHRRTSWTAGCHPLDP